MMNQKSIMFCYFLLFAAFVKIIVCMPLANFHLDNENDTLIDPDLSGIIVVPEEEIDELNIFEKQLIVQRTIIYLQQHLTVLEKAALKFNDEKIMKELAKLETDVIQVYQVFDQTQDLNLFDDNVLVIGLNIMELQMELIEKLTGEAVRRKNYNEILSWRNATDTNAFSSIQTRLRTLWQQLNDFFNLIRDLVRESHNK